MRSGSDLLRAWRWPVLSVVLLLALTTWRLQSEGRLWICSCGYLLLWSGDIWNSDNSQHLLDPYSITHLLHGIVFFWLLAWSAPSISLAWRFVIAVGFEATWEMAENSAYMIDRYREGTVALGYTGDTIVNSLSDIAMCGLGFILAYFLGWRRSIILFVIVEVLLMFWIRDSLLLNILMLIRPVESIKIWQMG